MSAQGDWPEANNEYLAASLAWLRLRLQRLAEAGRERQVATAATATEAPVTIPSPSAALAPAVGPPPQATASRGWFGAARTPARGASNGAAAVVEAPAPPAPAPSEAHASAPTELEAAAARRDAAAAIDPPPGLLFLASRLGLSDFERDTVLLCAAADLDPGSEPLIAALQGGPARGFPTFGLALRALDEPTWDALSPHRPLRRARLVEINQPGATPLTAAALRADERIVNLLKGLNALDERVAALVTLLGVGDAAHADGASELAPSQRATADAILERLRLGPSLGTIPVVYLVGVDPRSKAAVAQTLCGQLNRRLYRLGLEGLPTAKEDAETFARLWQREASLLPVALYVDADNADAAGGDGARVATLVAQDLGLVFAAVRDAPVAAAGSTAHAVDVDKPTPAEQRDGWKAALPAAAGAVSADENAKRLAGQFNLNLDDIRRAAALGALAGATGVSVADRVWDACRSLTQPRLDALAQRLVPKATSDDLVLSPEAAALLGQITAQVRGRYRVYEDWGYARRMTRGLGISALFAGESGVGKTMAAEVIANELRLHLYRIDLSAVVSKYIGDTEKNLRRLFDAAEQGGAILLFDEADALFGKRSEIKDSHDRYANIEINYLLQRMEAFSGLAILATNMKGALDAAFMRRLRFVVNFPFPGLAERRRIWQKALPPDVPREGLDYDRLARFNLSGGNIHSVALNAAFLAAQRALPVTAPLIMSAVRSELRKLDKPINEAEFR